MCVFVHKFYFVIDRKPMVKCSVYRKRSTLKENLGSNEKGALNRSYRQKSSAGYGAFFLHL